MLFTINFHDTPSGDFLWKEKIDHETIKILGKNSNFHIKAEHPTFVNVQLMLPCVSFKRISQAARNLSKADT